MHQPDITHNEHDIAHNEPVYSHNEHDIAHNEPVYVLMKEV